MADGNSISVARVMPPCSPLSCRQDTAERGSLTTKSGRESGGFCKRFRPLSVVRGGEVLVRAQIAHEAMLEEGGAFVKPAALP